VPSCGAPLGWEEAVVWGVEGCWIGLLAFAVGWSRGCIDGEIEL
jgi:hypothetical protein